MRARRHMGRSTEAGRHRSLKVHAAAAALLTVLVAITAAGSSIVSRAVEGPAAYAARGRAYPGSYTVPSRHRA
jgi:hypothetical protein